MKIFTLKVVLALGSALTGTAAFAQEAADDATTGEIVVTAQRRSESLQKVPVSVTAVTSEMLASRQISDLTQIARAAPSLQVGSDNTFAVRGVGTLAFAGTVDSSVALALDEVNLGRPFLGGSLFNDLERVEVLNGPQGLLFGKNASAGLLNIITAKPKLGEFSSKTDLEMVSRDTPQSPGDAKGVIIKEVLNIPVSANSALRINALYSYQEPGVTFVGKPKPGARFDLNSGTFSIKGKYLLEASDALSIYVIADYNELTGVAGVFGRPYTNVAANSVNLSALAADGITPGLNNFSYGGEAGYYRDIKTGGAQARVAYTLGSGVEISNILAWRFYKIDQQYDIDNLSADGASINETHGKYNQYSNEFRVALPAGNRLSGQAGIYLFKSKLDQSNIIRGANYVPSFVSSGYPFCVGVTAVPGAFPPTCSVSNVSFLGRDNAYVLDTESYAGFGQLTYDISSQLKVFAGGRVTRDQVAINLVQGQFNYFTNLGGPRGTINRSYSNTDFSWKVGAQFQATPDIMLYGFYGRGYKGPGFNDVSPQLTASLIVKEESSKALEAGIKSSFFDRRLTVNLSAFQTKFDNFQVQSFDPVIQTFQILNAAKVTTKGIEASVSAKLFDGFTVNGSAALLSAKFGSFPGAQCYPTQATNGCSATVSKFDATGLRLPNSPEFTSTMQAKYELPSSGSVKPFIEGNWYHRSSVKSSPADTPGGTIPLVDIFGASIGAQVGEALRVSLFCRNCTNVHMPTSIGTDAGDASARNNFGQPVPKLTLTRSYSLDAFRTIGASLSFKL
jgi:iron complex outermembrane recepter protein